MPLGKRKKLSYNESRSQQNDYPYRNLTLNLHTCRQTFQCAIATPNPCIPCAYKIATFDIALDSSFTKIVPNTRPEMCPRACSSATGPSSRRAVPQSQPRTHSQNRDSTKSLHPYGYREGMKVLTVGDGDFSFSLALARLLCKKSSKIERQRQDKQQEEVRLVATSYESLETLQRVYPSIQETIDELDSLNVKIFYNVDATNLAATLPFGERDYHRIIWNFPCTAIANGQDGQNQQMKDNQMLVKKFVKQCADYLCDSFGEIHFMHKTKPPYDQWGLEVVAVEDGGEDSMDADCNIWNKDRPCPFEYKGRVVFDKCLLPPYTPRKALDKKSFPCHDACLYVFGWKDGTGSEIRTGSDGVFSLPSTIPCENEKATDSKEEADTIPVSKALIDEIRSLHLSLGSYKDRKKRRLRR